MRQSTAVLLFALGMAGIAFNDALIKQLSTTVSLPQILALRSIFGVLVFACFPFVWREMRGLNAKAFGFACLRGLLLASSMGLYFASLSLLTMANALALFFTAPLFIALGSALLFGEHLSLYRIGAILAGLVGALLIAKPSMAGLDLGALLAAGSVLCYAAFQLLTRFMRHMAGTWALAGVQNMVYIVVGLLASFVLPLILTDPSSSDPLMQFLLRPWRWLDAREALMLLGCAVFMLYLSWAAPNAYRNVEASAVAPFEYTTLVIGVLIGLIWFAERPDLLAWLGMALIMGAGLVMLGRASARDHQAEDAPA